MKLNRRIDESFNILNATARPFGKDRIVDSPVNLLMSKRNISRVTALQHIKELEGRRLIAVDRDSQDGKTIDRVRVLKEELVPQLHEKGEAERLLIALGKYKTRSGDNSKWIVHAGFFQMVFGEADVSQPRMYHLLTRFEKKGWVKCICDTGVTSKRFLFVELSESFPHS